MILTQRSTKPVLTKSTTASKAADMIELSILIHMARNGVIRLERRGLNTDVHQRVLDQSIEAWQHETGRGWFYVVDPDPKFDPDYPDNREEKAAAVREGLRARVLNYYQENMRQHWLLWQQQNGGGTWAE